MKKYIKLQRQVSYDGGRTWTNMSAFKVGALIENDSNCQFEHENKEREDLGDIWNW